MAADELAPTLRPAQIKARLLSGSTLANARAVCCAFALISAVGVLAPIMSTHHPPLMRVSGVVAAGALAVYWVIGWRRGRFPLAGEPIEAMALFLILRVAPGHPFVPLCGLLFRSLYGGYVLAIMRWAAWSGVIIGASAVGGRPVGDVVPRAFALVIIPIVMPGIRAALTRLEASEQRLESLIENSTDVVTVLDDDLRIVWQARSIRAVLGFDARDWLGTRFADHVHPDDRDKVTEFVERARGNPGYSRLLEIRLRAASGRVRWFEIAACNRLHDESVRGFVLNIRDATDRRRLESERRTRELMQQRTATQRLEIQALRERMEAEHQKRQLRERLQHVQRLESVGALAGGVAHDFNNLLAIILNYVSFVRDELPEESQARADVDEIGRAAERGAHLTEQLLAFGQRKVGETEILDVAEVIAGMRTLLDRPLGQHIELRYERKPDLWRVEADPTDIEQIMLNLVVNARDALDGGGVIIASAENVEVFADRAAQLDMAPGCYVRISVEDNGCGIDKDTLGHIWEPFFTTKPPGEGSGLGLATVYGIGRQNGGGVAIASELGVGTKVDVYLPARELHLLDVEPPKDGAPSQAGRGRVLLVEDEPPVRETVQRILGQAGYDVVPADGAEHALRLLTENCDCDLLLTDVIMPGMWGDELAARARELFPELPVLFVSGYSERFLRRGRPPAPGPVLTKPLRDDALLRQVAALIGRREGATEARPQLGSLSAENSDNGDVAAGRVAGADSRSMG
jgi:PAS domain S-box-containing protein